MPIVSAIASAASAIVGAIGASFTAISGFTIAGFSAGNALLSLGLSMGLQAVGSLFQKTPQQKPGSVTSELQIGGNIPRQAVFGRLAVKGQLVYAQTSGASNSVLKMVLVLSDGWCGPISRVRVNEKTVTIDGGGAATGGAATGMINLSPAANEIQRLGITGFGTGGAGGSSDPSLILQYYDGRPGQTSNADLVSSSGGRLASADRFAGMAYVIVTAAQGTGNFDQIPDIMVEFAGYRCYDLRKDGSASGSGAHRRDQPATWEPSDNPAIQAYNYLMGIQSEGQSFMGLDVPAYDLLDDVWSAAANICDEAVALDAGGTELRYRSAHLITAEDADHRSALAPLLQAMAGYLIERGGAYGIVAGAAYVAAASITDADIVWDRGVTWSASRSRTTRVNEVHGQFLDASSGWQANSYPRIESAAARVADGERLAVSLDLAAVLSVTQAQRIARARLRETRREGSATLSLGMHYCWLEAGDWISWNSAQFATTRTYRVMSRDLNPDDTVTITLAEVGNEIYSWSAPDELPYQPPAGQPTEPPLASTVSGFVVQADVLADRSVVRANWTAITDTRIIAVIIEYRPVGGTNATRVRDDSPYDGVYIIDQPPTGASYEYRATIVTVPPRLATWTPYVSLAAIPTYSNIDIAGLSSELQNRVNGIGPGTIPGMQQAIDDFRLALDPSEVVRAQAAEPILSNIRREIDQLSETLATVQARFEQLRAANIEAGLEINSEEGRARIYALSVLTTDTITRFNEVSVSLNALDARITLVANTVVDGDFDGLITQITNVGIELDALEGSLSNYVQTATFSPIEAEVVSLRTDLTTAEAAIVTRATQTALNDATARITTAETTISAFGNIIASVSAVTQAIDIDLTNQTLAQVLALLADNKDALVSEFANANNQIGARIDETGAAIATASLQLTALTASTAAGFISEQTARASADSALTIAIESLTSVVNNPITGLAAAKATADTAVGAAATADGKAEAAQSAAVNAQSAATTADGKATTADGKAGTALTAATNANDAVGSLQLTTNAIFGGNAAGTSARFTSYANSGITEAGFSLLAFNTINSVTYSVGLQAYAGPSGRGVILGGDGATVVLNGSATVVNGALQGPNGRMQIRLENNTIKVFDASGVLRVHIGDLTQ